MITQKQKEVIKSLVKHIKSKDFDIEQIRKNIQKENEYFKRKYKTMRDINPGL